MLMQLGSVVFDVVQFNTHENTRSTAAGFAEKAVLGRRPPLEFVGEGPETMVIRGRIFPEKLGGLDGLGLLDAARRSGDAQFLMRGDGRPLGFFVVTNVSETSRYLNAKGVGKQINFDLTVKRSDDPTAMGYFSSIFALLGG